MRMELHKPCNNCPFRTDVRVCGENLYAHHSIFYSALPSYFLVFGIYDQANRCLAWDETLQWCELLSLKPVPVLYRGIWDEKAIKFCWSGTSKVGGDQEGCVVRLAESFPGDEHVFAKYVRPNHVQTDEHWLSKPVVPNQLAT